MKIYWYNDRCRKSSKNDSRSSLLSWRITKMKSVFLIYVLVIFRYDLTNCDLPWRALAAQMLRKGSVLFTKHQKRWLVLSAWLIKKIFLQQLANKVPKQFINFECCLWAFHLGSWLKVSKNQIHLIYSMMYKHFIQLARPSVFVWGCICSVVPINIKYYISS